MRSIRHITLLALMALFIVSCTKDAVAPCGGAAHEVDANANAKNRNAGVPAVDPGSSPAACPAQSPGTGSDPAGDVGSAPTGISDDGDDISDSEKSRKKPRR
ncbi:MAG: hypothetical protein KF797_14195 [Flavobacteriales bacterium]|nr:hypothetical protein [Flavobacteriales bacterium]